MPWSSADRRYRTIKVGKIELRWPVNISSRLLQHAGMPKGWNGRRAMRKLGLSRMRFFVTPKNNSKRLPENSSAIRMGFSQISGDKLPTASTLFCRRASSNAALMIFYPSLVEAQKGWTRIGCLSAGIVSLRRTPWKKILSLTTVHSGVNLRHWEPHLKHPQSVPKGNARLQCRSLDCILERHRFCLH